MDNILRDFTQRLMYQGLNLEEYCKYTGMTQEQLRESTRNDALRRCTNQVVLDAITKAEGFTASDEEVEAKIEQYAKQYNQDVDTFKKNLTDTDRTYMAEDVAIEKTLDFLVDNAKIVEKKEAKTGQKTRSQKGRGRGKAQKDHGEENHREKAGRQKGGGCGEETRRKETRSQKSRGREKARCQKDHGQKTGREKNRKENGGCGIIFRAKEETV